MITSSIGSKKLGDAACGFAFAKSSRMQGPTWLKSGDGCAGAGKLAGGGTTALIAATDGVVPLPGAMFAGGEAAAGGEPGGCGGKTTGGCILVIAAAKLAAAAAVAASVLEVATLVLALGERPFFAG
jgi:hypothetical protein